MRNASRYLATRGACWSSQYSWNALRDRAGRRCRQKVNLIMALSGEQETNPSFQAHQNASAHLCCEEAPLPEWGEFAGEAARSTIQTSPPDLSRPATAGRPDETHSEGESEKKSLLDGEQRSAGSWVARSAGGHDIEGNGGGATRPTAASALTEGSEQRLTTESPVSRHLAPGAEREGASAARRSGGDESP